MPQLPISNEWLRALLRCLHLPCCQLKLILEQLYHLAHSINNMSPYLHHPSYLSISALEEQKKRVKGNRTLPVAATDGQ